MDLELRQFRREYRKRGGWTLTVHDEPSGPDRTEISPMTDKDGRPFLRIFINRGSVQEAFAAANSPEVLSAIREAQLNLPAA